MLFFHDSYCCYTSLFPCTHTLCLSIPPPRTPGLLSCHVQIQKPGIDVVPPRSDPFAQFG
ncbi:hypothetical protein JMJ77_0006751, partial [Colletotrichum scovillei]